MRFLIEARLLDHFGVAMYNTLEKAIAELAANSYDADASEVQVTINDDEIVIADDGRGMTPAEVQDNYLRLGRDRRAAEHRERTSGRNRPIIGHKGIGKLAGLGIAETMTVKTWREGQSTTLTIERSTLDEAESLEQFDLQAEVSEVEEAEHGTEIRLEGLLDHEHEVDEEKLREHLASELPTESDWRVVVNGTEASANDIPGERFPIDDEIEGFGRVKGFYKIVKRRQGMPAGFAVRIRKRIVQPTSLFGLNQQAHGFFVLTRIVGELEPDFIDPVTDDADPKRAFDINTSRTGLNPESPRVEALEEYARQKLTGIADGIAKQRAAKRKAAAKARNPALEARMQRLGPEVYSKLNAMIDKVIAQLAKNESNKTIDELVDIIVRYYESDALATLVDSIKGEKDEDVARLAELLAQFGAARISDIAQLVHGQLIVIESLRAKIEEGSLEKEIHKVIATNIWLLRERLTYWYDNKAFSTQLANKLADEFKLEAAQRPDLVCYDNSKLSADGKAGKLLVIEFKRPGVAVGHQELAQVMTYKSIFKASLAQFAEEDIEVIILGDTFDHRFDRSGMGEGYTVLSYLELLENAKGRYRDIYETLVPEGFSLPGLDEALAADNEEPEGDEDADWEDAPPEPLQSEQT